MLFQAYVHIFWPKSPIKIQNYKLVLSRPPFKFSAEKALLQNYDIDCLISKNSGGNGTKAKIKAALQLSIPIILIRRPPNLPGLKYNTVGQCVEWLKNRTWLDFPVRSQNMVMIRWIKAAIIKILRINNISNQD